MYKQFCQTFLSSHFLNLLYVLSIIIYVLKCTEFVNFSPRKERQKHRVITRVYLTLSCTQVAFDIYCKSIVYVT